MSRYRLETDAIGLDKIGVTVEVDDAIFTEEMAGEINHFWSGAEDRIDESEGDVKRAALLMVAITMIHIVIESGEAGPHYWQRQFDVQEGFPQNTFKIVAGTALPSLEYHEVTIRELTEGETCNA